MPVRMAVIGAGHMGKIHLGKLTAMGDVQIVGVIDTNMQLAEDVSGRYEVPFFSDYREVLNRTDGVIISSPTETHYEIANNFLENDVHVFIEKPIANTVNEASSLVKSANSRNLTLQIGHLERLNPAYKKIIPYIKNPVFIETRRTSNFTGRSTDIDVVLDLMIHDIDLILSIVKADVKDIRSQGASFVADKLDMAGATLEFANGCIASLFASRISANRERTISVFEKDRCLFADLLNGKATLNIKNKEGVIETTEYVAEKMDSVMDELTDFVCSIKGEKTSCARGEDGLRALALADRIKKHIA